MFDIDIYVKPCDKTINGNMFFCTEVKGSLIADGLGHYIIDNVRTPGELEALLHDVNVISDFRETLYEGYEDMPDEWNNEPLNYHDADMRMYKVHLPKFLGDIKELCHIYGLSTSED